METAQLMNKIERAHQIYRDGRYEEALSFYTEALAMAKTKAQKIALHSNRAACYLKLHDFKMAAEECTSVLELDHKHTGALMLRAQTLVTLKEYQSALFDVNRLIELNPSSEVYQNLQASLKTQVSLAPIPEDEGEEEDEDEWQQKDERAQEKEVGGESEKDTKDSIVSNDNNGNFGSTALRTEITSFGTQKVENERTPLSIAVTTSQTHSTKELSDQYSSGWRAIPKPKGHSHLDYSRWDRVEDDSSEGEDEDDSDEESQPPYRFRVRTVGVRQIK